MKKLNLGTKKCFQCGETIQLKIKRDLWRKKFCCRSCSTKYYIKNKIIVNPWKNPEIARKMKKNMKKPHRITDKLLKAQETRGFKRRKSWMWYVENKKTIKFHQSQDWRDKAKEIYKRDDYICQECKITANELRKNKHKLNCHHIVPINKNGDMFNNKNLITLCEECHSRRHPELHFFKKN